MNTQSDTPSYAVVTGASRGIGHSIAVALAERGHQVFGTSTTAAGAEKITSFGCDNKLNLTGVALDVNNAGDLNTLREAVPGPVTVLVNNAGIARDNLLLRMSEQDWDDVIQTNLRACYRLSKLFLRDMIKQRHGRIINLSSVVAASGNAGQSNYCASKAGVIGLTKSLALEVASRNITVNAISPGFIATDMTATLKEKQSEQITARIPCGRFGQASEVAALAAFLVSDEAGYITGENIQINGGLYMG